MAKGKCKESVEQPDPAMTQRDKEAISHAYDNAQTMWRDSNARLILENRRLITERATLKASVREETLREIEQDPSHHFFGIPIIELKRIVCEYQAAHSEKAAQPVNELETRGTMECPICGVAAMHPHSRQEIVSWLKAQGTRFGVDVVDALPTMPR